MAVETLTKPLDRWDLIAERVYGVPDLAWAIAEANPALAGDLILPAGITLNIPEINTLRRPLTAANPAREDDGDFIALPADDSPAPIPTGGGTVSGDFVPLAAVGVTVAPLFNGLVPVSHLPAYPTLTSLGAAAIADVNAALALTVPISAIGANSGVAPLDSGGKVPSSFLPSYPTLSSLGGVASSTYTAGLALKADASALTAGLALKLDASARNAASGVAGLNASSLIDINQLPLGSLFPFTASASFRGGSTPAIGVSLTQAGVDASGQPRYWLVNAAATAGNRLKSITVASNGNIIFGHHADDGAAGIQVELTASGNLLTAGTVRPGSGATSFTGAQFVPGATFFRTDILGDSGSGCLTFSDGTANGWRRVSNGSLITLSDPGTEKRLTGTTAATQGATVSVAHGLTGDKIVGFTVKISQSANAGVDTGFKQSPGYAFTCYHDPTNFYITNQSGDSANILSKAFSIIVKYIS